jgi:hypothetical protein
MAKTCEVGDLVLITFWDHAEQSKDVFLFELTGRVVEITQKAFIVKTWSYARSEDRASDSNTDNENYYAIVRRAVDNVRILT